MKALDIGLDETIRTMDRSRREEGSVWKRMQERVK
jgi:hypothetical protein